MGERIMSKWPKKDYGPGDYETIPFRNDPLDPRYKPTQEEWEEDNPEFDPVPWEDELFIAGDE